MIDSPDLWEVRELSGELTLELRARNDPALVLTRARTGSARSLPTSRRCLTWRWALGLFMPAGQDYGKRWQWAVNTRPEAGRMKVVVIQQGGRQWQRTRRLAPGAQPIGIEVLRGGREKVNGCTRAGHAV